MAASVHDAVLHADICCQRHERLGGRQQVGCLSTSDGCTIHVMTFPAAVACLTLLKSRTSLRRVSCASAQSLTCWIRAACSASSSDSSTMSSRPSMAADGVRRSWLRRREGRASQQLGPAPSEEQRKRRRQDTIKVGGAVDPNLVK
jgi:hypothetical protein